jgi:hypothetical protein
MTDAGAFPTQGVCAAENIPTAKAPQRFIFPILFMQHIPVLHLDEATFGRANRRSCRFVVT